MNKKISSINKCFINWKGEFPLIDNIADKKNIELTEASENFLMKNYSAMQVELKRIQIDNLARDIVAGSGVALSSDVNEFVITFIGICLFLSTNPITIKNIDDPEAEEVLKLLKKNKVNSYFSKEDIEKLKENYLKEIYLKEKYIEEKIIDENNEELITNYENWKKIYLKKKFNTNMFEEWETKYLKDNIIHENIIDEWKNKDHNYKKNNYIKELKKKYLKDIYLKEKYIEKKFKTKKFKKWKKEYLMYEFHINNFNKWKEKGHYKKYKKFDAIIEKLIEYKHIKFDNAKNITFRGVTVANVHFVYEENRKENT